MSVKSHQLQAVFARRREQEHMRIERTAAQDRYYDHWGKVTTRFENWSTPEYYRKADEKLQQSKDKKEKEKTLEERRAKLQKIFAAEKATYELEMRERERPRSRKITASTQMLKKIDQCAKQRENSKRKLEMEAKLYGRWRHGVDDENLIFESKSDNQVLAKLNWLDKQIDGQLQREKEEAQSQERQLRMQLEVNKMEQAHKERQQIREQEIKEIRALQESHMEQLKKRQQESDSLRSEEKGLRVYMEELQKELELLEESSAVVLEPAELSQAYNLKKIKIFIRKRSEVFRNQIQLSINILERIGAYAIKLDTLKSLLDKYKDQLEAETQTLAQIEAMYESEAKYNLQRCEELWQAQHLERYHELKQMIGGEQVGFSAQLNENLQRQTDIIEMRSTHLATIETSNEKLRQLIKEQEESPPHLEIVEAANASSQMASPRPFESATAATAKTSRGALPKVTNSFTNLNLDVWQDMAPSPRGGIDSPRIHSQRSFQVVTPDTAERPRFGRKRVAWN